MKHVYPIIYIVTVVLLIFISFRFKIMNDKQERYKFEYQKLKSQSMIYLNSLTKKSFDLEELEINLTTGSTVSLKEIQKPSLGYFYYSNDCMSCVEENIFALIELVKNKKLSSVYIITTVENEHYLRLLSKVNTYSSLNFGIYDGPNEGASNYILIYEDGKSSNKYYPQKGEFDSTKKYLEWCCNSLQLN